MLGRFEKLVDLVKTSNLYTLGCFSLVFVVCFFFRIQYLIMFYLDCVFHFSGLYSLSRTRTMPYSVW